MQNVVEEIEDAERFLYNLSIFSSGHCYVSVIIDPPLRSISITLPDLIKANWFSGPYPGNPRTIRITQHCQHVITPIPPART